jgi:hypothetical protein
MRSRGALTDMSSPLAGYTPPGLVQCAYVRNVGERNKSNPIFVSLSPLLLVSSSVYSLPPYAPVGFPLDAGNVPTDGLAGGGSLSLSAGGGMRSRESTRLPQHRHSRPHPTA